MEQRNKINFQFFTLKLFAFAKGKYVDVYITYFLAEESQNDLLLSVNQFHLLVDALLEQFS